LSSASKTTSGRQGDGDVRSEREQPAIRSYGIGQPVLRVEDRRFLTGKGRFVDDNLVISSFNWMATSIDSRRSRGAEIGALMEGPVATGARVRQASRATVPVSRVRAQGG
jgi:hypothetical protein